MPGYYSILSPKATLSGSHNDDLTKILFFAQNDYTEEYGASWACKVGPREVRGRRQLYAIVYNSGFMHKTFLWPVKFMLNLKHH